MKERGEAPKVLEGAEALKMLGEIMKASQAAPKGTNGSRPVRSSSVEVPLEAENDPHRLARVFLNPTLSPRPIPPEYLKLRYWRGAWWEWDGSAYREVPA